MLLVFLIRPNPWFSAFSLITPVSCVWSSVDSFLPVCQRSVLPQHGGLGLQAGRCWSYHTGVGQTSLGPRHPCQALRLLLNVWQVWVTQTSTLLAGLYMQLFRALTQLFPFVPQPHLCLHNCQPSVGLPAVAPRCLLPCKIGLLCQPFCVPQI